MPTTTQIRARRNKSTVEAIVTGKSRARPQRAHIAIGDNGKSKGRLSAAQTSVILGDDDLTAWDVEELRYGRRRGPNGKFRGAKPRVVIEQFYSEYTRRIFAEADAVFKESLRDSVIVLTGFIKDEGVRTSDRLRAIEIVLDRTLGKPKEKVEISSNQPWLIALQGAIVAIAPDQTFEEVEEADVVDVEGSEP